jgi:hypothetical protein
VSLSSPLYISSSDLSISAANTEEHQVMIPRSQKNFVGDVRFRPRLVWMMTVTSSPEKCLHQQHCKSVSFDCTATVIGSKIGNDKCEGTAKARSRTVVARNSHERILTILLALVLLSTWEEAMMLLLWLT